MQNKDLRTQLDENKQRLGLYYYLFVLLLESGCRITEALNIKKCDISKNGDVLIRGLKGSEDRVCSVSLLSRFFTKALLYNYDPFFRLNRFSAYRHLRNLGIGYTKQGRVKASVTHAFRDQKIKSARSLTADKKVLKKVVGHKSIVSQEFYGKD